MAGKRRVGAEGRGKNPVTQEGQVRTTKSGAGLTQGPRLLLRERHRKKGKHEKRERGGARG